MPSPLSRTVFTIDSAVLPPSLPLLVLAVEVPLLLVLAVEVPPLPLVAACAALLAWSSPSCFTVSPNEAAISSPLSSVSPSLESGCPDTATKVS